MAKKSVAKKGKASSKSSGATSWWNERSKVLARTAVSKKPARPRAKKASSKKAGKVEKGNRYYCEVCGSEIVCLEDSAGEVFCCEEPMVLIV